MGLHRAGRLAEAEAAYRQILAATPDQPAALHLLGLLAHQTGHPRPAIELVTRALRGRPEAPPFLNTLGIALLAAGDLDRAAQALERAVARAPRYAEAHLNLGNLRRRRGEREAAVACYRRALACNANLVEARNNLGTLLLEMGDAAGALPLLEAALKLRPGDPQLLNNVGAARRALGRDDAIDCFREAVARRPTDAKALTSLAEILMEKGYPTEAVGCFERAVTAEPSNPIHRINLGAGLIAQQRFDEARRCLEAVAAAHPSEAGAPRELGRMAAILGCFDEALAQLERAHRIDPDNPEVLAGLIEQKGAAITSDEQAAAERLAARTDLAMRLRAQLHFALGKALEAQQAYAAAFEHLAAANRLGRDELTRQGKAYDPIARERLVDGIIARCDAAFIARHAPHGSASELPVFIVGMPRSGTTLCEQILSSHSAVHGAGELHDIGDIATVVDRLRQDGESDIPPANLVAMAERYVETLRAKAPQATRVVDKLPVNFQHLGLIAALFPRARIIHCRRDPRDTGLSCFAQNFVKGLDWSFDLASIGHFYRQYRRLMVHWQSVLPMPVLAVDYEELVDNVEDVSRRLVEFCGLPWEDRCLDFHRSKRPVYTSSLQQVRRPIYRSSLGAWRRYEPQLAPLITALEAEDRR
jgi:tetratricopeptide (TPR) repeat protein